MAKSKLSQAKHRIGSARITGYSRPIRNLKFRTSKGYSYGLKSKQRADFNRQNTTVDLPKHRLSTAVMGAKHRISGLIYMIHLKEIRIMQLIHQLNCWAMGL